ncbi:MAG: histidinol dehydrogenase, partial [Spirochaetaceae bacterium]|nr:histidinol dehydrogenase [Spirochaetaceae bacterium]
MARLALRRVGLEGIPEARRRARDAQAEATASRIVDDVESRGEAAVREWAVRLGELAPDAPLVIGRPGLKAALDGLDEPTRGLLERARDRITAFAVAQRASISDLS